MSKKGVWVKENQEWVQHMAMLDMSGVELQVDDIAIPNHEKVVMNKMKTFTLHVDFDGRREDGEMLDGRKVLATDEDDAYKKFNEEWMNLEHFGAGWRIVDEDEEEAEFN